MKELNKKYNIILEYYDKKYGFIENFKKLLNDE